MKIKTLIATLGLAGCTLAITAKDAVIMTINGEDITRSEFEYIYNKNSQQQLNQQPIEEYVEMFKIYKLKVADAIAEGIDQTREFNNEFNGYRAELAAPYMIDSVYVKSLMKEAYERAKEEIEVSHIMLFKAKNASENIELKSRIDSISEAIRNGADFSDMARRYSQDQGSAAKGGYMGFFTSMMYPYSFESAAYALKPGEISEVVESPVGYHIIKQHSRRPYRGKVLVQHILKLVPQGISAEDELAIKEHVDSIYNVAINNGNFNELAMTLSDDKGSARNAGKINWFQCGQMVPEFDSVSFALNINEISMPIRTRYGWHIIKKLDVQPLGSFESMQKQINNRVTDTRDERHNIIEEHMFELYKKEYKLKENKKLIEQMRADISVSGIDSAFFAKYKSNALTGEVMFSYAKTNKVTLPQFIMRISTFKNSDPIVALDHFNTQLKAMEYKQLKDYVDSQLENKYPDFCNLVNEYRDGILLFEVSNRKVWDKATKDTVGLEAFFNRNRADYAWGVPHVKGYLVQTANDSIAELVRNRMNEIGEDSLITTIKKEFQKRVKIEKILVAKGENAMVDHLAFGEAPVQPANMNHNSYFLYDFVILNEPEEVADVRGQVTSDYQNLLEEEWIEELKSKYPIVVYEKELRKIKQR